MHTITFIHRTTHYVGVKFWILCYSFDIKASKNETSSFTLITVLNSKNLCFILIVRPLIVAGIGIFYAKDLLSYFFFIIRLAHHSLGFKKSPIMLLFMKRIAFHE